MNNPKFIRLNYQCIEIDAQTKQYFIFEDQQHIDFNHWIEGLVESKDFRIDFNEILKTIPYDAFFWETPALTLLSTSKNFEFVAVHSKTLSKVSATPHYFAEHFNKGEEVVSFKNLGGDAQLIVPCQTKPNFKFPHIGTFIRNAPLTQIDAFWEKVGMEYKKALSAKPIWLNTSGLGVYWLHVRIDSRPKYYTYHPYRNLL